MKDAWRLTAHEAQQKLKERDLTSAQLTESVLERIASIEPAVNAYITVTSDLALQQAAAADQMFESGTATPLTGIPVGIKDVIVTKGAQTTAGSRILEGFVPPYDAHVSENLRRAGAVFVGKTNMDEFAMGSSTEHSGFGPSHNPWDLSRVPGGSSGGSAAAVAAGECLVALGSDTGGSIRQPAALCGVVGMDPTYGRVSRYGLIAYASSLDQIGPLTKDVTDAALFQHVISGHDEMDSTASDIPVPDYASALNGDVKGMKAGIVKELMGEGIEPGVRECVEKAIQALGDLGIECEEVGLPHCDYSLPVYYIIAPAECSSNLARFDGVRYGHRTEESFSDYEGMFAKTRAEGFGPEVRLRIIKGTYVLSKGYYDAYYVKALKVRQLIRNDFDKAFERFDVLISPTSPCVAFRIGERADDPLAMKMADICTIPVNLAGIPALSLPCGLSEGLPVGLQVMGKAFDEETVLRVGYAYEQQAGWVGQKPKLAAQ